MKPLIENIIREEVRSVVREYFGSLLELERGPVFQVHSAMTKDGLTKAVRKTKRSRMADMRKGEQIFEKAPPGVSVDRWESRWASTRHKMQSKTGYKWRINRDHERGGVHITRVW
jgi:hypothetical protein